MKVESEMLKKLGPVPFWRGERRCLDALGEIYRRAQDAAMRVVQKEKPRIAGASSGGGKRS